MTSQSKSFIRSEPSSLVITLLDKELNYRAGAQLAKDEKKFLEEKIRCTACNKHLKNVLKKGDVSFHPSFEVIICEDCEVFYASGEFSVDEDGSDKYCRWCGQGGSLYCCSKCSVAICEKCVKINFPKSYRHEIEDDDWKCFICDPKPIWPHRAIAAAVREYLDKHKLKRKKKRNSEDSDSSSPPKSKRPRNDASDKETSDEKVSQSKSGKSKIIIDSSDENDSDSKSKKRRAKKNNSSHRKSSKKGVITISDDGDDDCVVDSPSKKEKSETVKKLEKHDSSEPEEDSDLDKKSKRTSKKSNTDYIEEDDDEESNLRRRSRKVASRRSSNRRSKRNITDEDELDSDKSVFRDKNSSKKSSRKTQDNSKSSPVSSRMSTNSNSESDNDAIKLFQYLLKDSLKDIDKLLQIIVDRKKTFLEKYVNDKKKLKSLQDVGVVKEKYIAFLGNFVSSTKRIESTFFSSVEPLISSAASKKAAADANSNCSPTRASSDSSQLDEEVQDKSSTEVAEKSESESEAKKKDVASTEMEVDDDAKVDKAEFQDTSIDEKDVAEFIPIFRRKSSSPQHDTDIENDTTQFSGGKNDTESETNENSPNVATMTNGVEENCNLREDGADETTINDSGGVSDSMIVNLGTEDESLISEKDSVISSKKKKCAKDDTNSEMRESEAKNKSSDSGSDSKNPDSGDSAVDGKNFTTLDDDDLHSKSAEELAKDASLRNSESSSENETRKGTTLEKVGNEHSEENDDRASSVKSSSPVNGSSDTAKSKEKQAKNDLWDESDENGETTIITNNDQDLDGNSPDFSKSKEKKAKNDLLLSSDSSTNDNSKSNSESGMSGIGVLNKNSDDTKSRQKRRKKRISSKLEAHRGKDSEDEDKEINRLMNLNALKKKKARAAIADSDEEAIPDSEKENQESKKNVKKSDKKSISKKSLEDYISDGSDNRDTDNGDEQFSELNNFLDEKKSKNSALTQNDFCKQQLLDSSDSNDGNESDVEDELILPSKSKKGGKSRTKEIHKEQIHLLSSSNAESSSDNDKKKKKQAAWRNDNLLRGKLSSSDSSDDEKIASRIRRREAENKKKKKDSCNSSDSENLFRTKPPSSTKKNRKTLKSSSDESSSSSVQIIEKKETKKRKLQRKRIKNLWTDSEDNSDNEDVDNSLNTQGSASKGRKNIRKVLKDEELAEETKITAKQEEARKKRIAERQTLFNEVFQVVDVESEAPSQLVLDFDPETKTELVSVHPNLVKKLKPHQVKGIKFMWDSCFESIKQIENGRGSGCILAHCMGLGKTLQVIALVHTVLRYPATTVQKVLIICPVSTILNWVKEFKTWLNDLDGDGECDIDIWYFNKNQRNAKERAYLLKRWSDDGGVMILGYDMFRILVNSKTLPKKWKENIHQSLLDPGADLVVCDEGHTLKNEKSAISVAAMKIKTRRRIVLTGTPLQNNLIEYHCMVQFIKPNLLGDKKEFQNRFANPITNGQFTNSTAHDVRLMKRRSHVLHKMLDGFVQRFDYNVLTPFLPPKHEFVISVALSDLQATLYDHYIKTYSRISNNGENRTLFKDYQIMRLIWTHPFAMNKSFEKRMKLEAEKDEADSMEDFIVSGSDDESSSEANKSGGSSVISIDSGEDKKPKKKYKTRANEEVDPLEDAEPDIEIDPKAGAWWRPFITDEDIDDYKQGPKLVLLFAILRECELIGDKVLIFSQSIPSLDMIEHFLQKTDEFSQYASLLDAEGDADYIGTWRKNADYFRLDGSTPSELRTEYTNRFNHPSNSRARLFLISTKAGGLGINLTAANRVIIFDASWNPSHDVQSIFRVYRFGQKKPCYIYRFLSQGTMEEKIYERQVTKLSISCRVVDEQQIDRHFSRNEIEELYTFARKSPSEDEIPRLPKDRLMAEILKKFKNIILSYHEHDSLLENIVDEELTEEERKQAWEEYEEDKKPKPVYPPFRYDGGVNVPDEVILRSLKQQNPNATPEYLEDLKNKVRFKMLQYYAEQQRRLFLGNQQNLSNIHVTNKKELDEQLEMKRRALANNMLMTHDRSNSSSGHNPGFTGMARYAAPETPTKMGISPSKYASYASPVKSSAPFGSPNRTPLKHVNDHGFPKAVGGGTPTTTDVANLESSSTFKPLETPSTWAFRWSTPRSLVYLEGLLKANCRFLARYERVGENVLMHLPFCVRADTLKRKLADYLADISFTHVSPEGLDQQDVLDVILDNLWLTDGANQ